MMTRKADTGAVLCVGRIYCDLIFTGLGRMPTLGREVFAEDLTMTAGGGAYISAAHFAEIGRAVSLVARLGTDALSCDVAEQIKSRDIDLSFLERDAEAGPQITVASVIGAERAFLTKRAGRAEPAHLNEALHWDGACHLHIAEFATLAEMPDLVFRAKEAGLSVSLDPSWDDALIHAPDLLERCNGVDLFLPNMEEAQAITGKALPNDMLDLLSLHFPNVALKAGADGAYCQSIEGCWQEPAQAVPVIDTTGAGDAFNAGFIDQWLRAQPLSVCLAAGVAAGSRAVQQPGGA
nr:PfkB family carbohydrate kinase [uncultured Cohaesibacter sp.]